MPSPTARPILFPCFCRPMDTLSDPPVAVGKFGAWSVDEIDTVVRNPDIVIVVMEGVIVALKLRVCATLGEIAVAS